MNDLSGKLAVITGAGSGFGREFARLAARNRMRLALADIDADAVQAVAGELAAGGTDVMHARVDVADSVQVQQFAERVSDFGAPQLLINNAGVAGGGLVWENSDADWQWLVGVNLMGVVHGLQHFVPRMLKAERQGLPGHIVNVASVAGWLAAPLMGIYNATKHAVVGITETLHHDLRLAGSAIGVTLLCPAYVPTGIATSHRHRPRHVASEAQPTASQRAAQAASEKAVASGKLSAAEVAEMTFAAVRENRFCVFTHPQIIPAIQSRIASIVGGQPPADPYAARPATRPTLQTGAAPEA